MHREVWYTQAAGRAGVEGAGLLLGQRALYGGLIVARYVWARTSAALATRQWSVSILPATGSPALCQQGGGSSTLDPGLPPSIAHSSRPTAHLPRLRTKIRVPLCCLQQRCGAKGVCGGKCGSVVPAGAAIRWRLGGTDLAHHAAHRGRCPPRILGQLAVVPQAWRVQVLATAAAHACTVRITSYSTYQHCVQQQVQWPGGFLGARGVGLSAGMWAIGWWGRAWCCSALPWHEHSVLNTSIVSWYLSAPITRIAP